MHVRCGTDIVDIIRIEKALKRGGRFINKVYTDREIESCESKKGKRYESYAARFAAKEAFLKALGVGMFAGAALNEIEIANDAATGAPALILSGGAARLYDDRGGISVSVSLSHTAETAVATVVALFRQPL
jgi:holo-[acyl-carrier protein] synthase